MMMSLSTPYPPVTMRGELGCGALDWIGTTTSSSFQEINLKSRKITIVAAIERTSGLEECGNFRRRPGKYRDRYNVARILEGDRSSLLELAAFSIVHRETCLKAWFDAGGAQLSHRSKPCESWHHSRVLFDVS